MGDLKQWVDVIEVDLPESEYVERFRMKGREVNVCVGGAK
jgi:hypothetical protein